MRVRCHPDRLDFWAVCPTCPGQASQPAAAVVGGWRDSLLNLPDLPGAFCDWRNLPVVPFISDPDGGSPAVGYYAREASRPGPGCLVSAFPQETQTKIQKIKSLIKSS